MKNPALFLLNKDVLIQNLNNHTTLETLDSNNINLNLNQSKRLRVAVNQSELSHLRAQEVGKRKVLKILSLLDAKSPSHQGAQAKAVTPCLPGLKSQASSFWPLKRNTMKSKRIID
jgi:hypothetical protein